jgi:hypothetical protein
MIGWLKRSLPMLLTMVSLVTGPTLQDQTHLEESHTSYVQAVMEEASISAPPNDESPSDKSENRPAEKACHIGVADCQHFLGLLVSDNRYAADIREQFSYTWDDGFCTRTIVHDCRPPILLAST